MPETYKEINVKTALEEQTDGKLLLDVREPGEFEAGHALGAVSIPLSELRDKISEIDVTTPINVICKSGGRSAQAAIALLQAGFNATNVQGGSLEWVAQGQPFVCENGEEPKVI